MLNNGNLSTWTSQSTSIKWGKHDIQWGEKQWGTCWLQKLPNFRCSYETFHLHSWVLKTNASLKIHELSNMKEDLKKTLKCCCARLTVSSGKKYLPGKRCQRSGHVARCEKEKLRQTSCKPDVTSLKNGRSYTLSSRTERDSLQRSPRAFAAWKVHSVYQFSVNMSVTVCYAKVKLAVFRKRKYQKCLSQQFPSKTLNMTTNNLSQV